MVWLFLILAIILEVGAALSLRVATNGKSQPKQKRGKPKSLQPATDDWMTNPG